MRRLLPTLFVIVLLGGTAAAFGLTEGLKLQQGKITAAHVDKVFSPTCGCSTDRARIQFSLPNPDVVTVSIVSGGHVVRTLARSVGVSGVYKVWWNGKDDHGRRLKDGSYKPRVKLEDAGRTFTLPNPITLDTKPPEIHLSGVAPRTFSPDGDLQHDLVTIHYRINEPGRALLYVNGKRRIYARLIAAAGSLLRWRGLVGGRALPAGRYSLVLKAEDAAGNVSKATPPVVIRIRYIELAHHRISARANRPFKVRVLTDALAFRWQLGRRAGTGHDAVRLRVGRPGWYRLTVSANGHSDRGVVRVAAR